MDYLPLFFQLRGKPCLLIGGGDIALRKAKMLCKAGGILHVVAPTMIDELGTLVTNSKGSYRSRDYAPDDLTGMALVVVATENDALDKEISRDAHSNFLPVNVVDKPELCSFIFPSIVDRSPLIIALSSAGQSPVLARLLRAKIESMVPAAYGRLATLLGKFRSRVQDKFTSMDQRRHFWEDILQGPLVEMVLAGNEQAAEELLANKIEKDLTPPVNGEVYLVGAGPGDPDLLTFKALRLMQKADVVLYDRLVADEIIALTRHDADKIYVGKSRSEHSVPQYDINQLLVDLAMQGKKVLRLKGGDPFIFGRGGEEIQQLAELGIPFQVVPGITAASGCAAYAGIPLTHRDYAQSVRFVTGHLKDGSINLPWDELVHTGQTLVFYMGLVGLPTICQQLIKHGRNRNTPIALIQKGTTREQKIIVSDLGSMPEEIGKHKINAPTLLIVGDVVKLRPKLQWFDPVTAEQQSAPDSILG